MHVERRGGHWRGAPELALGRGHALREPVAGKGSALYPKADTGLAPLSTVGETTRAKYRRGAPSDATTPRWAVG